MPLDTKAYAKEYYKANKERLVKYRYEWKKERMQDPEYRTRQNELQRLRRAQGQNPEQIEKTRTRAAKWKKDNPGKVIANTTARKKHVRLRTPDWLTPVELLEMECIYVYCAALRRVGLKYEVDHELPLLGALVSGLHVPSNLLVVHADVNRAKSNTYEVR